MSDYICVILCNDVGLHAFMIIYACEQHDVHRHHHRHHNNNKKTKSACWTLCNNTTFPRTSSADEFPTGVPAVFTIPRPSNLKTFPLFGFVTIYGYCNGENPTNHFPFSKYTISKSKSIFQVQILWLWSIIGFGVYPIFKQTHLLNVDAHVETVLPWPPRYPKIGFKAIIKIVESTPTNTDFIDIPNDLKA